MQAQGRALVAVLVIVAVTGTVRYFTPKDPDDLPPRTFTPAEKRDADAAAFFHVFRFKATEQRAAWCRAQGVALRAWAPAFDRAFAREKAGADAIAARLDLPAEDIVARARQAGESADVEMGRFAAERRLKGPEACAAMDAEAEALARALPFPERHREVLAAAALPPMEVNLD